MIDYFFGRFMPLFHPLNIRSRKTNDSLRRRDLWPSAKKYSHSINPFHQECYSFWYNFRFSPFRLELEWLESWVAGADGFPWRGLFFKNTFSFRQQGLFAFNEVICLPSYITLCIQRLTPLPYSVHTATEYIAIHVRHAY